MFGGSPSGTTEGPGEGSGVPMENLRIGEPGDDAAWWNGAEDSATIVPIPYSSAAHTSSSITRMPVGPQCFHYKYAMKIEPMAGGTGGVKSGSGDPVAVGSFDP